MSEGPSPEGASGGTNAAPPGTGASITGARRWGPAAVLIVAVVLGSRRLSDALDSVIHLSPLVIAVVVGIALGKINKG